MLPAGLNKIRQTYDLSVILVAPRQMAASWMLELLELSLCPPIPLDGDPFLMQQVRTPVGHVETRHYQPSNLHAWLLGYSQCFAEWMSPGEGTPSILGDMDVPPFWPPFLTFWGLNSIFLGTFSHPLTPKRSFGSVKTTNPYRIRSFWPQIPFFPRSFGVQFSVASGTPPSVFGPSTNPPPPPPPPRGMSTNLRDSSIGCYGSHGNSFVVKLFEVDDIRSFSRYMLQLFEVERYALVTIIVPRQGSWQGGIGMGLFVRPSVCPSVTLLCFHAFLVKRLKGLILNLVDIFIMVLQRSD